MKKILMLLCAFLFSSACATSFGETLVVGVPYAKTKVVYPRVVQKTLAAPGCTCGSECACGACAGVSDPRVAKVKVVYPRVVQRTLVAPACGCGSVCACAPLANVDDPRIAKVKVTYPRVVQRSVVVPMCE